MTELNKPYHKKTILQVVPALVSGGVERGTIEIASFLKKSNYENIVVSAGGPLVKMLDAQNIKHIKLNVISKNPFIIWYNSRKLAKIIQEHKVDIIHARSRAPAWSCYIAARATGCKFVTTFHGIYNISNWFKKYYNSIMTKGTKVVAVSKFVKEHIIKNYSIAEDKIRVIHRGVDLQYFDPHKLDTNALIKFKEKYNIGPKVPVILLPARMSSWKGHSTLVEALYKIKNLDFYCLIVGELSKHPNLSRSIRDKITNYKMQHKIQIFGNESDMRSLYGISDIVLSTSSAPEAFGRTIIEGQAMEKLVIATSIGGASETIIDQVTGYHVAPSDPDELAEKIKYCLSILGTDEAKNITAAARATAITNFSLDLMLNKTLQVYEEII